MTRRRDSVNYKHNPGLTPYARVLRRKMTREEYHLWYDFLRSYSPRFLRQKVIDEFIVDFYCSAASLVIKLDGGQHYEADSQNYDARRTEMLSKRGLTVIRIPNNEIWQNFNGVC